MKVAVHWFRCDLRLADNAALHAACTASDAVVPVFIFDPKILRSRDISPAQVAFMIECLRSLEKNVEAAGGRLVFRHGPPLEEMSAVLRETEAHALFYNRDYEPYARERDAAVEKLARSLDVEVHSGKDNVVHEPDEILNGDGKPYGVFTPYSRRWRLTPASAPWPAVKFALSRGLKTPASCGLLSPAQLGFKEEIALPPAGERAARAQLRAFVSGDLLHYAENRDFPARDATSRLSPHLRLGTLSPRTVLAAAAQAGHAHPPARKSVDTFVGELIWRDFYKQILWHFPHVAQGAFRPKYDALPWENDPRLFAAWCEGRTGYPLVDAGMRQLNTTGWMHNRLRMIVANFLTKDLLISWQWGETYFMQKLLDADLAANNGGWQWSAGTGTDAQPWFRIFNPTAQAEKFDPEGRYIHRYVPEVDTRDYPAPIVNHAEQRLKALELFRRL
jgi:deoxyribodipyrimidine photo-lyase